MSQCEMLPVVEVCDEARESKRLSEIQRVEAWSRGIGQLTPDKIKRNNNPQWQWDDYAI